MGKASEFDDRMSRQPPMQPGELWPVRPELRIRADAPSVEVGETLATDLIESLNDHPAGMVVRDGSEAPRAVILTPERYAELAGCMIESEDAFEAVEGTVRPKPEALGELMIEQADSAAQWQYGSRIWQDAS